MRDQCTKLRLPFTYKLHLSVPILYFALSLAHSKCVLVNFGDSNTDPGALVAALGLYLGPPIGQQFFHRPTGRFCNCRLYIDFICQSLDINLLSAFLESSSSDFTYGVNFAWTEVSGNSPFSLSTQTGQFRHFQNRTRELRERANSGYQHVVNKIPFILERIEESTEALYRLGARNFWIYNTGLIGYLPQTLALQNKTNSELDEFGCLNFYNNAAKAFNEGLRNLCNKIRSELQDTIVVHTDMFPIKYDLFANPGK